MKNVILLLVSFWAVWIVVAAVLPSGGDGFLAAFVIAAIAAFPVRLLLGSLVDQIQEMRGPKVSRALPPLPKSEENH